MRLIDADELMKTIKAHHYPLVVKGLNTTDYGMFTLGIQQAVDEQPTIEAEPVRHGHWIRNDIGAYSCSRCQSWIPNEQHYYARYCLFCGAKMDECGAKMDGKV